MIGSLFSGYGGLDSAAQEITGLPLAFVADIEPGPCKILAHHYPDVPNLGDVTAIDWSRWVGKVGVLTGGFPCQDVSLAGRRDGLKRGENRSGLWGEMRRAIDELRPGLVLIENVRGLLSATASIGANRVEQCVCGGADRRGGLRPSVRLEGDVPGPSDDRDDEASTRASEGTTSRLGRLVDDVEEGDIVVGGSLDVDSHWRRGGQTAPSGVPKPPAEVEAGRVGHGGRTAAPRSTETTEWVSGLEFGNAHSLRADQGGVARAEREGAVRSPWGQECRSCASKGDSDMEPCPWCLGDGHASVLRALGAVLGDLADLGYDARWHGLRAADVGACHGRFRVFIAAYPADSTGLGVQIIAGNDARSEQVECESGTGSRNRDRGATARVQRLVGSTPAGDAHGGSSNGRQAAGLEGQARPEVGPAVALLPTPAANIGTNGGSQHPQKRKAGGHSVSIEDVVEHLLLPTPTATTYGSNRSQSAGAAVRPSLHSVDALLPTPRASDGDKGGPNQRGSSGDLTMPSAVQPHRFGAYDAAIRRHEYALGRSAPEPTEAAPRGGRRLSARFVEWMQCLPDGWVTGVPGITRSEALRALGNGVVPPQAVEAFRQMGVAS